MRSKDAKEHGGDGDGDGDRDGDRHVGDNDVIKIATTFLGRAESRYFTESSRR